MPEEQEIVLDDVVLDAAKNKDSAVTDGVQDEDGVDAAVEDGGAKDTSQQDEMLKAFENRFKSMQQQLQEQSHQIQQTTATNARSQQRTLIEQAVANEESKAQQAEYDYAQAMEAQDFAAAARNQRVMAAAESNLTQLRTGLAAFDENQGGETQIQQTQQPKPQDEFEAYVSRFSPPSQQWIRLHKDDLLASQGRAQLAQAAHTMALNAGHAVDSDDYFAYLDSAMGYGAAAKPKRALAAPASRQNNGASASKTVRLTSDELEMAKSLGMTAKEYAASKQQIAIGESDLRFRDKNYG